MRCNAPELDPIVERAIAMTIEYTAGRQAFGKSILDNQVVPNQVGLGLVDEIDLVVAGGIRNGADVAKCLALGAKAVAIGHSALMALNCNKEIPGVTDYEGTVGVPAGRCYHCHTGRCPVGITTQDPELRKRLRVDEAAMRVYNFLHTLTLEAQMLARACGKTNVHSLEPEDLCALTVEASAMARVPLAGTNYIPGQTEERALAEIKALLEKNLPGTSGASNA